MRAHFFVFALASTLGISPAAQAGSGKTAKPAGKSSGTIVAVEPVLLEEVENRTKQYFAARAAFDPSQPTKQRIEEFMAFFRKELVDPQLAPVKDWALPSAEETQAKDLTDKLEQNCEAKKNCDLVRNLKQTFMAFAGDAGSVLALSKKNLNGPEASAVIAALTRKLWSDHLEFLKKVQQ